MKKYVVYALIGLGIGLVLAPIAFVELYYIAGETAYIDEVVSFKNFQNILIVTPLIGMLLGLDIRIFINFSEYANRNEINVKSIIKFAVSFLAFILSAYLVLSIAFRVLMNNLSESIKSLIVLNLTISVIVIMIISMVVERIMMNKINKKLAKQNNQ